MTRLGRLLLAIGAALLGLAAAPTAHADITIGLTGGAPQKIGGQTRVAGAGVTVMSWAGNQTPVNPLIPNLGLRVQLRTALELPALNASYWTTVDEPWWNHISPSFVQQQVDVIHAAPANPVAVTNQGWPMDKTKWPTAAELAQYPGDILSVDSYPTPGHRYAEMGAKVALMHSIANGRPVWAALQVCSRSNFATHGIPSAKDEWEMAKRALQNGATGIMFFGSGYANCFHTAKDRLSGFNWTAWYRTVLPTIRRIQAATP